MQDVDGIFYDSVEDALVKIDPNILQTTIIVHNSEKYPLEETVASIVANKYVEMVKAQK